jgi:glycosyltransferase involved in cell wall biosynthesis
MRLLVVDHNAVEPVNQELYRLLSESGDIRVRVIIPSRWHDNYAMRQGNKGRFPGGCEVVPVPVFFSTRTHRLIYRGLERQVGEFAPDVLFMNSEPENFQTYECARIVRRHPRVKLVFSTWRNIDYADGIFPYKASFLHNWIEKKVLAVAAHGIAFNESAAPIFKRLGFDDITFIPPELDTRVFTPGAGSAARPFTVGYAGRLEPLKGVDDLIQAVAGLPDSIRLRIVGSGSWTALLQRKGEVEGVASRIDWIPPVRRSAMPGEYHRMDVLVLPSRTGKFWKEQFGRVLVEAMACGVPVVGSDSGEIPGVIGDAGLIYREGDVKGLRGELARLREDGRLRKALAGKGLARVSERYEIRRVVPMYRNLLMALTNKPGG